MLPLICVWPGHIPHEQATALAVSRDGSTLFTRVRPAMNMLKSSDGGETWTLANRGLPDRKFFAPFGGQKGHFQPAETIVISPAFSSDQTVFAAFGAGGAKSACGLWRSRDGGINWNKLSRAPLPRGAFDGRGSPVLALAHDFAASGVALLIGSGSQLLRSEDHGETFQPVRDVNRSVVFVTATSSALVAGDTDGEILWSTDGGNKWRTAIMLANVTSSLAEVATSSPSAGGPIELFAGTAGGVWHIRLPRTQEPDRKPTSALLGELTAAGGAAASDVTHVCSTRSGALLVVTEGFADRGVHGSVFRSTDGGRTWANELANGLAICRSCPDWRGSGGPSFSHLSCADSGDAFVASYVGIFRHRARDSAWRHLETIGQELLSLSVGRSDVGGERGFHLSACPTAGDCVTASVSERALRSYSLQYSPDGAPPIELARMTSPWPAVCQGEGGGLAECGEFDSPLARMHNVVEHAPNFERNGVALRSTVHVNGLLRTIDGGATWSYVKLPTLFASMARAMVHSIAFSPTFETDATVFVGGFNLGVARSTDGGATFETSWRPPRLQSTQVSPSPHFASDQTVLALLTPLGKDDLAYIGASLSAALFPGGYDPGEQELHLSKDGGRSWEPFELAGRTGSGNWTAALLGDDLVIGVHRGTLVFRSLADRGWCAPLKSRVGLGALQVDAAGREVLVGLVGGGAIRGRPSSRDCTLGETAMAVVGAAEPMVFDLPSYRANAVRGYGRIVAFSPDFANDGVLFGASFYSVLASLDRGSTWRTVFRLGHTTSRGCDVGCRRCSGGFNLLPNDYMLSKSRMTPSGRISALGTNPQGARLPLVPRNTPRRYCLVCDEAYPLRNASDGTCSQ